MADAINGTISNKWDSEKAKHLTEFDIFPVYI